jgi:hypothetical protein
VVDVAVLRTLPGVGISFATKITGAMHLYLSSYTLKPSLKQAAEPRNICRKPTTGKTCGAAHRNINSRNSRLKRLTQRRKKRKGSFHYSKPFKRPEQKRKPSNRRKQKTFAIIREIRG